MSHGSGSRPPSPQRIVPAFLSEPEAGNRLTFRISTLLLGPLPLNPGLLLLKGSQEESTGGRGGVQLKPQGLDDLDESL